MRGGLAILLGILAVIWSALAWFVWSLAGAGGAAVVAVTRWLEIDPSATQWLADTLSLAGGVAQWLVAFAWLLGMLVLGVAGRLASQAQDAVRKASRHAETAYGEPAVEGEIRYKKISESSRTDGKTG